MRASAHDLEDGFVVDAGNLVELGSEFESAWKDTGDSEGRRPTTTALTGPRGVSGRIMYETSRRRRKRGYSDTARQDRQPTLRDRIGGIIGMFLG